MADDIELAMQNRKSVALADLGICHYCSEPISDGHFCDADCRDDFEQINRGE